jgi:hypothetical protein
LLHYLVGLSIGEEIGDGELVAQDWRDERIAELEAKLAEQNGRIAERDARIAELEKRVAQLAEQLGQNSSNSHLPPSSDSPDERRQRRNKAKKEKQQRKRGGQKGHAGAHRELLPPDKVNKFVDLFPSECENCWKPLPRVPDASALRYQQTEVPPIQPFTTEWRRHEVACPCCRYKTRAAYDDPVVSVRPPLDGDHGAVDGCVPPGSAKSRGTARGPRRCSRVARRAECGREARQ